MTLRFLKHTALVAVLSPPLLMAVPVEIARESFDGTVGAIGFTTPVPQFDEPAVATGDFFSVQPNNGTKTSGGTVTGGDGAGMFAAEDIDTAPALLSPTQFLTTNPVNIAGKTSTSVRILLAAPGTGPAVGGTQNFYDHSATASEIDFVRVEASVDGGPFSPLIQFSPATAAPALNTPLVRDSNFDGLGDAGGLALTAAFQGFDLPFSTGNSVQVRVVMHSNATSEYICVDNIRIFADTPVTAPPVLGGVPATPLAFVEGSSAAVVAPAITVTDADSANITSATVTVSQNYTNGEDVLAATPAGGIATAFAPATGTLTLTGSTTKAAYETVLRSVTYRNTNSIAPNTLPRHVRFSVSDGVNTGNQPVREVQITDALITHVLPFFESFETDGRGTRYALDGRFTQSAASYFDRLTAIPGVTNLDGTAAVVAEDTETNAAPVKTVSFLLNTTGFAGSEAVMRFAAPAGAGYETGDIIAIETSPDGGAWQTAGTFRSMTAGPAALALDTNSDGFGDGPPLTSAMQEFTFNLPAANTLGLRVRFASNVAGERLVVDRISVTGVVAPIMVTNANDSGAGSLRAAIAAALAAAGPNTIEFDLALSGQTIPLAATLTISDAAGVTINASALPGGITLSGQNAVRVFLVSPGARATLVALSVRYGIAPAGAFASGGGGGGIFNGGILELRRCTVSDNDVQASATLATAGGGIANQGATLTLIQCTIANNSGDNPLGGGVYSNSGGGIWVNGGTVSMVHCTLSGNNPQALFLSGTTTIESSILAGNTGGDLVAGSNYTRAGTNFIGSATGNAGTGPAALTGDPRLGPLARHGGPTPTMAPLPGSPVRDRILASTMSTDQRGAFRGQWGASDIGSVEAGIQADCAWEVRDVFTSPVTSLLNLANTDAMLANPAATQITGSSAVVNFSDLNGIPNNGFFPTGDTLFLSDNLTPQGLINQDDDSFATQARAFITITTASDYTFGFSTDDGARLRLYSTNGAANPVFTGSTQLFGGNPNNPAHNGNSLTFDAPTGNSGTLGVCHLVPGVYGVELTMWEDFGGASAEVFFAQGARTAVDANFSLLGGNWLTRTPGLAQPVHDDFVTALPLRGAVVHAASCNAGATIESGEPTDVPGFDDPRTKSVWWTWTAPVTGTVQVDTIGSNFDTELAILTGSSAGSLTAIAYDSDSGGGTFTSRLNFAAVAGTVYRIQVSGYAGGEGNILLNIGPSINAAPSFTGGSDQSIFTSAGPQTVPGWATSISPGAPWETAQQVNFIVSTTNGSLFIVPPAVSPDGTLTYTPAPGAGGSASITVQIHDNGGTANGGVDLGTIHNLTITTALAPTVGTPLTVNVGAGSSTISQAFNVIGSASAPWVDNSTVPGWYAQLNDGVTPVGIFQPSDGATALTGLVNAGTAAGAAVADRALGSKATSTGGFANIAYAVVIRNTGNLPVKLSRLRYAEELWRSGSVAGMTEKVTAFYAISDAPLASIASGPSSATPAPGTGFTAMAAGASTQVSSATINTAIDGNVASNRSAVDFFPLAADMPAILPGQYLTFKWTDSNESAGTDGHQAIDDVTLNFTEIPCAIYAAVSNVVRRYDQDTGSTDTVDFTLSVVGAGTGLSAGWQVTAPAFLATGSTYGSPVTFFNVPVSSFIPAPVLSIRDQGDPACTTSAAVPLPLVLGVNELTAPPSYIQASGAPAIFRQTSAGNTAEVTMDPGTAVLTTDPVFFAPGTSKAVSLSVQGIDSSMGSGFEADDTLKVELLSSTPGGLDIETLTYDADINRNGVINGGATPLEDEFNLEQKAVAVKWTSTFALVGTIPADATSFRLRITGAILGNVAATTSEVYRFGTGSVTLETDSDGDGIPASWETAHGTNRADSSSWFGLQSVSSDAANLTLSVRTANTAARTYQLVTSPDLLNWTRDGVPVFVPGSPVGPWPLLPITRPNTPARTFHRVQVQLPQVENP